MRCAMRVFLQWAILMNGIMHGAFNDYPANCRGSDNTTSWCIQLDTKSLIKVRTRSALIIEIYKLNQNVHASEQQYNTYMYGTPPPPIGLSIHLLVYTQHLNCRSSTRPTLGRVPSSSALAPCLGKLLRCRLLTRS